MNSRRYSDAVKLVFLHPVLPLGEGRVELTEATCALLDVAAEVDSLCERLADDARHVAEKFARVAAALEAGHASAVESPCGYSSLRDVDQGVTLLKARREELARLARVVGGKDKAQALRDALVASSVSL